MLAAVAQSDRHDITPVAGSVRRLDGSPADLGDATHYPVEAVCGECARPIRSDRFFRRTWYHVAAFTMGGSS